MNKHLFFRKTVTGLTLLLITGVYAEKKPLHYDDFDKWKTIGSVTVSDDGRYALGVVSELEGDSYLHISDIVEQKELQIPCGYSYRLHPDGEWLTVKIRPSFNDRRQAKIKKLADDAQPEDTLAVVNLKAWSVQKVAAIKSFEMAQDGGEYIAYAIKDTVKKQNKEKTSLLVVRHIVTASEDSLKNVASYTFSRNGKALVVITKPEKNDSLETPAVYYLTLNPYSKRKIANGMKEYLNATVSNDGKQTAFYATADSAETEIKNYVLLHYLHRKLQNDTALILVDGQHKDMPAAWGISANSTPSFSLNGKRLFLGIAPVPLPKDTTVPDFEKAQLDIWHWNEPDIQPLQAVQLSKEKKRTYKAFINLSLPKNMVQLGDVHIPEIIVSQEGEGRYALGISNLPYRLQQQWDLLYTEKYDLTLFDLQTGKRRQKTINGTPSMSYNGNFVVWYDVINRHYYAFAMDSGEERCLTCDLNCHFWDEDNDIPLPAEPYGMSSWLENDKGIFVYDRHDIWQLDPSGKTVPVNITRSFGRNGNLSYRYIATDREEKFIPKENTLLLSVFDYDSRKHGYALIEKQTLQPLILDTFTYNLSNKAKKADVYLFSKSNFTTSPDLFVTVDRFKTDRRLTDINPQKKEFRWGTVELVEWTAFDGNVTQGLLYKPENLDTAKRYPMITYFYERYSNDLYKHYTPAPSRSIINFSYFVSQGYAVFVPDIHYKTGHPGQNAFDYVVSGVNELCRKHRWIDADRLGIQGQSWGGYQTAYLITKTNLFKAAGAGAPVVNMFSAYNGIRWESGMSRQFQYEQTQSRIGQTMWEAPELYHENSPVFFAPDVKTPLLIMHNDNDGAVPWYQGIEYFMALRRLGKPVWLLQYNNEAHNLLHWRNRKDLTRRLQQFFDYYLKDAPMPQWMKFGVPVKEKGINYGFDPAE